MDHNPTLELMAQLEAKGGILISALSREWYTDGKQPLTPVDIDAILSLQKAIEDYLIGKLSEM